jgi:acetate kinase
VALTPLAIGLAEMAGDERRHSRWGGQKNPRSGQDGAGRRAFPRRGAAPSSLGAKRPSPLRRLSPPAIASSMAASVTPKPVIVTDEVLGYLKKLIPPAPLHEPHNIAGILAAREAWPHVRQVTCFDAVFRRDHPFVNDVFAMPRRFYDDGVRRYGFHGPRGATQPRPGL